MYDVLLNIILNTKIITKITKKNSHDPTAISVGKVVASAWQHTLVRVQSNHMFFFVLIFVNNNNNLEDYFRK